MNTATGMQLSQVAQWRLARNLFAVYAELASRSVGTGVCPPPYSSFGADDRPESLDTVNRWFDAVDNSLSAADFRSALGAITGTNGESALYTVAQHLLSKRRTDPESRKKLEFVLVQYFLACSPPSFHTKAVTCSDISAVLQPLIPHAADTSESLLILANLSTRLQNCATLRELHEIAGTLEGCKQEMGDAYYETAALAHITHAQYLMKLVARDVARTSVTEVTSKMEQLRERGVTTLDCRAAGLTDQEVLTVLVAKWKGLNESDIEYRLDEIAPVLLGMEKTLGDKTSGSNPQLDAEIEALRSLADRLSTQIAAITQRVQRLESLVPASGSTLASDLQRARATSPLPPPAPIAPIAVRAANLAKPEAAPGRTSTEQHPPTPPNGNTHR